jgi:hypothetical protein
MWRAIVQVANRDTVHTTWHLAACKAPSDLASHCPEGQRLLQTNEDPDGHCLIDNECGRCK